MIRQRILGKFPRWTGKRPDRLSLNVRAPFLELLEKAFIHEDEVLDGRLIVSRLPPFADNRQSRINPADACPDCQVIPKIGSFVVRHT
jgi:hypothetical protein